MALTNRPLGFINPLLYQMAADTAHLPPGQRAFNDIVLGNNVCPELIGQVNSVLNATLTLDNCLSVCDGYYTAPGWDPVSDRATQTCLADMETDWRYVRAHAAVVLCVRRV